MKPANPLLPANEQLVDLTLIHKAEGLRVTFTSDGVLRYHALFRRFGLPFSNPMSKYDFARNIRRINRLRLAEFASKEPEAAKTALQLLTPAPCDQEPPL